MLPTVSDKIDQISSGGKAEQKSFKRSKKSSKTDKKHKKSKKKSCASSSTELNHILEKERKPTEKSKIRKHFRGAESSAKSSSDSELSTEWIEKMPAKTGSKAVMDHWMGYMMPTTYSKSEVSKTKAKSSQNKDSRKDIDSYDPSKNVRELNPYWKYGGDGLPSFKKPNYDDTSGEDDSYAKHIDVNKNQEHTARQANWRKIIGSDDSASKFHSKTSSPERDVIAEPPLSEKSIETREITSRNEFLTDQQMNEAGAKLLKAEIMGNDGLVRALREKLERARHYRMKYKDEFLAKPLERRQNQDLAKRKRINSQEDILLTSTNSKGMSRPVQIHSEENKWERLNSKQRKQQKIETHSGGERVRYYADDDKYDIKQMVSYTA